nr:response regulator transcription factor [Ardenticatena sp.]
MSASIRVAVCGPLQFLQEALVHVLRQRYKMQAAHFVLPHECMSDTMSRVVQEVKQFAPDIVIFFPETKEPSRSLTHIESLTALDAKVILVTYTEGETRQFAHDAVLHGVVGVLPASVSLALLSRAIVKVFEGELWLDRTLMAVVLNRLTRSDHLDKRNAIEEKVASLTEREREVIRWLAKGLKNSDIADQMAISESTVRHHFTSIFNKLGMNNRVELLLFAIKHQLVDLDEV